GVGNAPTQRILNRVRKQHHLDFLAIMEPMVPLDGRFMARRLGFLDVVSNCGNQIWLFWGPDVRCQVLVDHEQLLHIRLESNKWPKPLFVTAVDFNTVLSPDERSGGSAPSGIAMSDFHDAIADCALVDAGYVGSPYTWYSRRLRQRLDRVLISSCWMTVFPKMQVAHLELSQSDHRGLLVEAECTVERKYPTVGSGMMRLQQKLTRLKHCLKEWNKTVFENVFDNVAAAERGLKEADEAYDQDPCDRTLVERNRCSAELVRVLAQEETFWRQKTGIRWAKDGFGGLFLPAEPVFPEEMNSEHLEDGLTDEDRRFLCVMPTLGEVRDAVFSIDPDSVAGPDGFGAVLFHTCWEIIVEDVFGAVTEFFREEKMPKGFTATTISLIPKTASPTCWSEYRPISLCNVTNKICTKLMTIRLGHVLPKVISLSQSGFVPGRLLSDNVLLAQELIHSIESRRPDANVVFKLDMAKAYDRGWAMTNLSHGGRLALIRSVLQATPLHLLQVIHPPKSVLIPIERIFNGFFWGSYNGRKHIHWSSWAKACFPVAEGGLGVRSLADYVRAFSMKLWWRFWGKSSLWSEYLHGRYCRNLHPTIVPYNRNHSSVWHHLCRIRDVAEPFILWTLGEAGQGDRIVWMESSTGDFSTKSAWEAIRQASPRRQLLADRRQFPICLLSAAAVQGVWQHFAAIFGLCLCDTGSLTHMVHFWRYSTPFHSDLHIRTLIPFLIHWFTWTQRNAAKYRGYRSRPIALFLRSSAISAHSSSSSPSIVRWHAPSLSWFTLNTDGSSLGNPGLAGAAGIIRNSAGHVHLAYQFALGTGTSVLAELTAVWWGELALTHGLAPLVVEVDATTVISLLQSRASGKEANGAADHLAKEVASLQLTRVLHHDDITGILRGIFCLDRLGVPHVR
ncbi:UNVERIFIED_CONTAM: hypothetical protein Scaly_1052200, partial [Sesamum calycinum]